MIPRGMHLVEKQDIIQMITDGAKGTPHAHMHWAHSYLPVLTVTKEQHSVRLVVSEQPNIRPIANITRLQDAHHKFAWWSREAFASS